MSSRSVIVPPPGDDSDEDDGTEEPERVAQAPEAPKFGRAGTVRMMNPDAPQAGPGAKSSGVKPRDRASVGPSTSEMPPAPTRTSMIPAAIRRSVESLLPAARQSILSMLPQAWQPRWKPWSPSRALGVTTAFAIMFGVLVYAAYPRLAKYAARLSFGHPKIANKVDEPAAATAAVVSATDAADAHLNRVGRSPLAGGLLFIPPGFHSQDGAYDLILHFNGNTDLVEESFGSAKVDALVVIFNLGVGSGKYEDHFANTGAIPEIIDRVKTTMEKRGLANPHLRRMGLGAWSAGYGGVEKALGQADVFAKVDIVYLLDALHCGYTIEGRPNLEIIKIKPFIDYAREAMEGRRLLFATHSEIDPVAYAGTGETFDGMFKELGIERKPLGDVPKMPVLQALIGVLPKDKIKPLTPKSEVNIGGLIVRGYTGEAPEDHISHLMQMADTALPLIVARWSAKPR